MTSALHPPDAVLDIAQRLEGAGYEAWCVGGAVRDAILGHPNLDWDIATSATPQQVREVFGRRRTIPVGVEFGTVGVLDGEGRLHEVTTFRRDIRTDGRHAEVEFGASLEEDLARRDFTMNAIAYSPSRDEIRDPFHGREDIARRIVRAVGEPDARMREYRLRALRAIRFAARFDFTIDSATLAAIERSAPHLGRLSAERVKQEIEKTMDQVSRPANAFRLWRRTGALGALVPPLADVSDHTTAALDCTALPGPSRGPYRRVTRIAVLFSELKGEDARRALGALRFSRVEVNRIAILIAAWGMVGPAMEGALIARDSPSDALVRRWIAEIGRLDVAPFMRLASAQWTARREAGIDAPSARAVRETYRRVLRAAFRDALELKDLAVDGGDLIASGIPPGPHLGKILEALLAAVLDDQSLNRPDWLLQEAKRRYEAMS
jgi:tRNA nucleotidyltransferase/poly(A) polymerase